MAFRAAAPVWGLRSGLSSAARATAAARMAAAIASTRVNMLLPPRLPGDGLRAFATYIERDTCLRRTTRHMPLARTAGLQARLHVTAGLGGDDCALDQGVLLRSDDFQIDRAGVAVLVEDAQVADEVDVAAAVGLQLRLSGALLPPLAVADMDVLHARDDGGDRLDRVLACSPDMRRVHVDAESGRADGLDGAQGGGRIEDARADVRLDAERDAIVLGAVRERAQALDGLLERGLVAGLAARAAVDDGNAGLGGSLEGELHLRRVLRGLLHGEELEAGRAREPLDLGRCLAPAVEDQVLAHAVDGG